MSDLIKVGKGEHYTPVEGDVIITPDHSFADIIRFLIEEGCDKTEAITHYEMEE